MASKVLLDVLNFFDEAEKLLYRLLPEKSIQGSNLCRLAAYKSTGSSGSEVSGTGVGTNEIFDRKESKAITFEKLLTA